MKRKSVGGLAAILLGNFLYAATVQLFLLPAGLVTGGTTGIALAAEHFLRLPLSYTVLLFNLLMLLLGWVVLGRDFALSTLVSSLSYPLFLELCKRVTGGLVLTEDVLLCTVFSGLGIGCALGVVIRAGASTGGMDIPPLVLHRLFGWPVSLSMYAFDFCILLLQAAFRPTERLLYGIVLVLCYTLVLEKALIFGVSKTEVKVVSARSGEIREAILRQLDRGVTMLNGESGYLQQELQVVLSVVSNRELGRLRTLILDIDPDAFLVISRVSEVNGRGFSLKKLYR